MLGCGPNFLAYPVHPVQLNVLSSALFGPATRSSLILPCGSLCSDLMYRISSQMFRMVPNTRPIRSIRSKFYCDPVQRFIGCGPKFLAYPVHPVQLNGGPGPFLFAVCSIIVHEFECLIIGFHKTNIFNFSFAPYAQMAYTGTTNCSRSRRENQLEIAANTQKSVCLPQNRQ
jgi:hypothetical protein